MTAATPPDLREHGPDGIRAELAEDWDRSPRHWVRGMMSGCEGCAAWSRRRARLSAMRRAYARRSRR